MTDVNINAEPIERKIRIVTENRGAERGIKELTVNITKNNGTVVTLSADDIYFGNVDELLSELKTMLLEELE